MHWYIQGLKKYAVFSGRAQRKEFWMFFLINFIIYMGLIVIEVALGIAPVLDNIYTIAILFPEIAVGVRRIQDTGHNGWWIFMPFVNLYFWCIDGTSGDNRFGPDPKADTQT